MHAFSQRQSSRLDERVRHFDDLGQTGHVNCDFLQKISGIFKKIQMYFFPN